MKKVYFGRVGEFDRQHKNGTAVLEGGRMTINMHLCHKTGPKAVGLQNGRPALTYRQLDEKWLPNGGEDIVAEVAVSADGSPIKVLGWGYRDFWNTWMKTTEKNQAKSLGVSKQPAVPPTPVIDPFLKQHVERHFAQEVSHAVLIHLANIFDNGIRKD